MWRVVGKKREVSASRLVGFRKLGGQIKPPHNGHSSNASVERSRANRIVSYLEFKAAVSVARRLISFDPEFQL